MAENAKRNDVYDPSPTFDRVKVDLPHVSMKTVSSMAQNRTAVQNEDGEGPAGPAGPARGLIDV